MVHIPRSTMVAALLLLAVGVASAASTDKLMGLIAKRSYPTFLEELGSGLDVNRADAKGKLPLVEAVGTKDVRFVDALLMYTAYPNLKEAGTGNTPLLVACKAGLPEIVKLLLAYGGDLDAENNAGETPRKFTSNKEVAKLVAIVDKQGPLAFEDEPGSWVHTKGVDGSSFWYHAGRKESRWNQPPSCAWTRVDEPDQPYNYINTLTHQHTHVLPPALAWRMLTLNGRDVWYNYAMNMTQNEAPSEMPEDLLQEAKAMKNVRWYNPRTLKYSWEDPFNHSVWRKAHSSEHKRDFYYNLETRETTWDRPEELAWTQVEDTSHDPKKNGGNTHFWWNSVSNIKQWLTPDPKAWEMQTSEL